MLDTQQHDSHEQEVRQPQGGPGAEFGGARPKVPSQRKTAKKDQGGGNSSLGPQDVEDHQHLRPQDAEDRQHLRPQDAEDHQQFRHQRRRNEPEWMNETISHTDVIELRGYDDKTSKKEEVSPPNQLLLSLSININKAGPVAPPGLPASGISVADLEQGPPQKPARRDPGNNDQNQNVINARRNSGEKPTNVNILNDLNIVPNFQAEQEKKTVKKPPVFGSTDIRYRKKKKEVQKENAVDSLQYITKNYTVRFHFIY